MKRSLIFFLKGRTDEQVLAGMARNLHNDKRRKAEFLVYLNEVDRRKLYAKQGYSSLFRFLTEYHWMSESSALKRMQAAKLASRYPFLYRDIELGNYSLSVLGRLSPFVKTYNSIALFGAAKGQSVRKVEEILADRFPKAEVEDWLQKKISPLGLGKVKVQFTAEQEFVKELEEVTALLSHKYPQGRMQDVLLAALKMARKELEKTKTVNSQKENHIPRGIQVPASRYIPREIQRTVWQKDQARCQHRKPDGSICGETKFLEMDHIQPYALGGTHRPENLRLLCWAHNALRAEATFGKRFHRRE